MEAYNFANSLARLNDLTEWLTSVGFSQHHRVRKYRDNIEQMLAAACAGEIDGLAKDMPFQRAREIFWSYIEADEFVRAVDALRADCGNDVLLPMKRALNGPVDLFLETDRNSEGRNFMFELTMAGRLAGAGYRPSFDKGPDIQFEYAGLQVAVECKRPLSSKGLKNNITEAISQLKDSDAELGIIAISVSRLLNPGDPTMIPEVPAHRDTLAYLEALVHQFESSTQRLWSGRLANAAILFYAFIPLRVGGQYCPCRYELMSPMRSGGKDASLLKCLSQSLNE